MQLTTAIAADTVGGGPEMALVDGDTVVPAPAMSGTADADSWVTAAVDEDIAAAEVGRQTDVDADIAPPCRGVVIVKGTSGLTDWMCGGWLDLETRAEASG